MTDTLFHLSWSAVSVWTVTASLLLLKPHRKAESITPRQAKQDPALEISHSAETSNITLQPQLLW